MYMSSFLTSSPVTWSKVRPSEETAAYLAASYRRTSKLTPSCRRKGNQGASAGSYTHAQVHKCRNCFYAHTHPRTQTQLLSSWGWVQGRCWAQIWFTSHTLMSTIRSWGRQPWTGWVYTWRVQRVCVWVFVRVWLHTCGCVKTNVGSQIIRCRWNIFTLIWFNFFFCSAVFSQPTENNGQEMHGLT